MQRILQDSARWALAGLAIGTVLAILVALATGLEPQAVLTLVIIAAGVGMCLGPPALIVHRASQAAGALSEAHCGVACADKCLGSFIGSSTTTHSRS